MISTLLKQILGARAMTTTFGSEQLSDTAREYLRQRRRLMDRYFLVMRMMVGLGVAGYLAINAMITLNAIEAPLAVVSYILANLGIWFVCQAQGDCRHTRWFFAGMDVTYILLIRHFFHFEVLADPNVTMAGFLALALVAYTFYSDPRLTASLIFASMIAVGGSLWADAAQTFSVAVSSTAANQQYLRATLLMGYLACFGFISLGLTLFTRQQTLDFLDEQHERIKASIDAAVERGKREHLDELNELKEEFIMVLSHELRTPISPLRSSLELLEEDLLGQAEALDTLDLALDATSQIQHLVQDYSQLAELLLHRDEDPPAPLNVELAPTIDILLKNRKASAHARSEGLNELAVATDPYLLNGALTALLRRADLLTPPDQQFTVRGYQDEQYIKLEIQDPTSQLDDAINEHIEDPFGYSEERTYYSPNSGLELTLAQHALRRLGGGIHVESNADAGTTVICSLPPSHADLQWVDSSQLQFQSDVLRLT